MFLQVHIFCAYIYADNILFRRKQFLEFLPSLKTVDPWIVLGDFNCMMLSSKRTGGKSLSLNDVKPLNEAIQSSEPIPVPSLGPAFTWSNKSHSGIRTLSKLDRVFFNFELSTLKPCLYGVLYYVVFSFQANPITVH